MSDSDPINHPKHYGAHPTGVKCIDIIEHFSFNVGSAVKYLWRAGLKDDNPKITDLQKARWYIDRAIKNEEYIINKLGSEMEEQWLDSAEEEYE